MFYQEFSMRLYEWRIHPYARDSEVVTLVRLLVGAKIMTKIFR